MSQLVSDIDPDPERIEKAQENVTLLEPITIDAKTIDTTIMNGGTHRGGDGLIGVSVCDTQPATIEGVRTLLTSYPDLRFVEGTGTLNRAMEMARDHSAGVLLVDKAFGMQAILEWMTVRPPVDAGGGIGIVIWGVSITEAEALRFLQAGARGILRKTAALPTILACLRTVAAGRSWMEDCVFRDPVRSDRYPRSELTAREQQVLELVEQGCKNKEIAGELGIRPGTVKIHLKHIFEKTGIRGRYGLALNSWRDRDPAQASA
jgi:DNA-binding NarL/FixJ family response regulator